MNPDHQPLPVSALEERRVGSRGRVDRWVDTEQRQALGSKLLTLPESVEIVPIRRIAYRMAEIAAVHRVRRSAWRAWPRPNTSMHHCSSGAVTMVLASGQRWSTSAWTTKPSSVEVRPTRRAGTIRPSGARVDATPGVPRGGDRIYGGRRCRRLSLRLRIRLRRSRARWSSTSAAAVSRPPCSTCSGRPGTSGCGSRRPIPAHPDKLVLDIVTLVQELPGYQQGVGRLPRRGEGWAHRDRSRISSPSSARGAGSTPPSPGSGLDALPWHCRGAHDC